MCGFAAFRGDEFSHFGVAVEHWGRGVALEVHDLVLREMAAAGQRRAWLTVYALNVRACRFYERAGWRPTGEHTSGPLPPHAELLTYERRLDQVADRLRTSTGVGEPGGRGAQR